MTLKSLELVGFKSFGKKSVVDFTTPITAIVGPNGSGKSNIVEAIRFVLGEQSMKSLRGKGGVDLIFKGSKILSSSSRASVGIVFDNTDKIFSFTNSGLGVSLDYDEIIISREVFADGSNKYSINHTEVRLKDIIDLLASVNIGSSGHHIISQGEADRVLNASNKERRTMIEDALGLKVYQYRIKDSEKKLEKTLINVKEVQALRREIAPHLAFLKKQVQAVEKAKEMRENLKELYRDYLSKEGTYIEREDRRLSNKKAELSEKKDSLENRIDELQKQKSETEVESIYAKEIISNEEKISLLRGQRSELVRKLGRIEGIIEGIEQQFSRVKEVKKRSIEEGQWRTFLEEISSKIDEAIKIENVENLVNALKNIKAHLHEFFEGKGEVEISASIEDSSEYKEMKISKDELLKEIEKIQAEEQDVASAIALLKQKEQESQAVYRDSERVLYELLNEKSTTNSLLQSLNFEEEKLSMIKNAFNMELTEAGVLIGREIVSFASMKVEGDIDRQAQEELRRKIERIKIKIEDAGSGTGNDVIKEYEETVARDEFLNKEINDLNKSVKDCQVLISELKEKLDSEFKSGVEKINKQFQEFFALMFGGGSAFLSITMEHKKPKKNDESISDEDIDDEEEDKDENEIGFERGIEINVSLPHKKVKDLHMLSGGERSLTSIALLFAISQVNPPPFLVLDETDAALDEANSRKYGNMLENLSKYSELIVVTHNRETMSRAQVLYGVTMNNEGVSKLLSIHLEDAATYAK